jgi:hypothetical protein
MALRSIVVRDAAKLARQRRPSLCLIRRAGDNTMDGSFIHESHLARRL